ncbi:contactin-associated protein like 5-3-like [Asterias rubens]|uniref:contactin-associated protein like 5-3-like n=1 Tax=Asterias rubens TaxID=7604 RepID=UPI0014559D88|nr:contactin-associated protein like 5-3-like [Asterias rubens]
MKIPRRGLRTSVRGGLGLSRTHARTVLLLLAVVGRMAWGWGEPDSNRRIGGIAQRNASSAPFRSCMDVLNSLIPKLDGFFLIDPDGQSGAQRFQVLCRLNSTHDHPGTTVIRTADNANSAVHGNSSITITYDGVQNQDSIRALIDISARCRQYLQYQCKNAPMWLNGVQQVAWVSWDGRYMPNWGGVETGHGRCACSRNASCAGRGHCNCDVLSPHGFYVDAGYITDKDTLPVVGLEFNYHEGYFSAAYYSVGDLECFGRDTAQELFCLQRHHQ